MAHKEIAADLRRTPAQVYAAAQRHGVALAGGAAERRRTDARISRVVAAAWRDPEKRARMHDGQLTRPLAGAAVAGSLRRLQTRPSVGERHASQLQTVPLYRAAYSLTLRWLDSEIRQDVIVDLVLACLSGEDLPCRGTPWTGVAMAGGPGRGRYLKGPEHVHLGEPEWRPASGYFKGTSTMRF